MHGSIDLMKVVSGLEDYGNSFFFASKAQCKILSFVGTSGDFFSEGPNEK